MANAAQRFVISPRSVLRTDLVAGQFPLRYLISPVKDVRYLSLTHYDMCLTEKEKIKL